MQLQILCTVKPIVRYPTRCNIQIKSKRQCIKCFHTWYISFLPLKG